MMESSLGAMSEGTFSHVPAEIITWRSNYFQNR